MLDVAPVLGRGIGEARADLDHPRQRPAAPRSSVSRNQSWPDYVNHRVKVVTITYPPPWFGMSALSGVSGYAPGGQPPRLLER
jgi:hypothetical protein